MSDFPTRTEWFREARFGMFIHWGLYAIPGRGEWVRSAEKMTVEEYAPFFETFNPTEFDPKSWAKAAKEAGMRYVVLTAKHHDGFCLFDTKYTDYKSTNTPFGRDIVAEFVEAVRAEGLKAGLYFSLIDWHHPHYPKYNDINHPMRGNPAYANEKIDFDRYLDFMHRQIEEILTNYGKLDILWFDYAYEDLRGEAWRAAKLMEMVRKHQPDVIVDNRLETSGEGGGSLLTANPSAFSGDFSSPEQMIPPHGIVNTLGQPIPWELCVTMNNNWGYNPTDKAWKSSSMLIRKLVECVSKGGNMILNVGPDAKGCFPTESVQILREMGAWLHKNGDGIYGCGNANIPKPEWGRYTKKGNCLYAHILESPLGPLPLTGVAPEQIGTMRRLADGSEIRRGESWVTAAYGDIAFACMGDIPHFTYALPDTTDTVLEIQLKESTP